MTIMHMLCYILMTPSNGNIIRVPGPLWGESTGDRRIPLRKASDTMVKCFLWSAPEQTVEQTIETQVIWDTIALTVMMQNSKDGEPSAGTMLIANCHVFHKLFLVFKHFKLYSVGFFFRWGYCMAWGCCDIELPSGAHLKLKSQEISIIQIINFSCQIVMKVCTDSGALLCAKFVRILASWIIGKRDFAGFELEEG